MEQALSELDKVQLFIAFQKEQCKKAIRAGKVFEEIKMIYLIIKDLQKQENILLKKSMDK